MPNVLAARAHLVDCLLLVHDRHLCARDVIITWLVFPGGLVACHVVDVDLVVPLNANPDCSLNVDDLGLQSY